MYTLAEISKLIGAEVQGDDSNVSIGGIATLTKANNKQLSYVNSIKYINELSNTNAGAVIINRELAKEWQYKCSDCR